MDRMLREKLETIQVAMIAEYDKLDSQIEKTDDLQLQHDLIMRQRGILDALQILEKHVFPCTE